MSRSEASQAQGRQADLEIEAFLIRCSGRRTFNHEEEIFEVAPPPIFSGFEGSNQRMTLTVEVRRGVESGRVVAATHVATYLAETQVDPVVFALCDTIETAVPTRCRVGQHIGQMATDRVADNCPPDSVA